MADDPGGIETFSSVNKPPLCGMKHRDLFKHTVTETVSHADCEYVHALLLGGWQRPELPSVHFTL
jgi:hypothetical protein